MHLKKFLKESTENEFEGFVSMTTDLIEEKVSSSINNNSKFSQQYLGLLCHPTDTYQIFGYLTNTNIAILAIIKNVNVKESEIKSMLIAMHNEYVRYVANPFTVLEQKITSSDFNYKIQIIGNQYTTQILQLNTLSNAKKPNKSKNNYKK